MSPLRGLVDEEFDRLLHRLVPITAMTQTLPGHPLEEGCLDANPSATLWAGSEGSLYPNPQTNPDLWDR
jgi:hypothetical protein